MPAMILHFFDRLDPNGDTIFECDTDDEFLKSVHLDIERDSMGGGTVNFARKVGGLFSRDIVVPETLVRVVIPAVDSDKYIWGFWINPRQQQVISKDEQGGEGFTFGGPGPKHYLERSLVFSESFTGQDDAIDQDAGIWIWPETASSGRIMDRLLDEDANHTTGPFLPDLTHTFSGSTDSDGVPWVDNISSNQDFTLKIGDDLLKVMWILEDASGMITNIDLGSIGDPKLQLEAWQDKGRNLTGTSWSPSVVHFIEGDRNDPDNTGNIATDLDVEGSSYRKASHVLMRGDDGQYKLAERPGWSPGEFLKVISGQYNSSNDDVLEKVGQRLLNRQENGERQIDLRIVPGFQPSNGVYFPGPPGTDGHFWLWDTVSLTTGGSNPTQLDYQDEPQSVTGIDIEFEEAIRDTDDLRVARSFEVHCILNKDRKSSNTSVDLAGSRGTVVAPPNAFKLCLPTIPPTESGGSTILSLEWDFETNNLDTGTSTYDLMATRQLAPYSLTTWWGWNGGLSTNPPIAPRVPIVAGQVVRVEGSFAKQLASSTSTSSIVVRFYSGSVGGTAIDTQTIGIPVSGAGAGVVAVIDSTVIAPTGATFFTIAPGRNLYADNITLSVEGAFIPDEPGILRSGLEELIGNSPRAARCDHRHHVIRDVSPQITDDSPSGYPEGTYWIVVDDVDAPTTIFATYLSVDSTDDAAVWITDPDESGDGDETEPNLRWEAVTDGEDVFVWEDDDLVHEFEDYSI